MRVRSKKASVVLVALSCVTVLGIAMASFLAVTNQAMRLSNRDYAKVLSKQLAEMGLETALRAYNTNAFASGWTVVGSRASATLTTTAVAPFPALPTFGNSGITPGVNIRVEHYLAAKKATPWSVLVTYAVGDTVWYQGVWYRCKAATTNQDPSTETYWTAAPQVWDAYANYKAGNIVLWAGSAYRCLTPNANQVPPSSPWIASTIASWSALTPYSAAPTAPDTASVVYSGGMPYRCIQDHTGQAPPNTTYWLSAPVIYVEGVATLPDSASTTIKTQLRATIAPAALFPNAAGSTAYTNLNSTGTVDSYNSVLEPVANPTTTVGSSAVLAGGNTSSTAVNITNVRVRGYLAAPPSVSSPYLPQTSVSSSGIVTLDASGTPSPRVDLARVSRSPYIPQFDVQSVTASNLLAVSATGTATIPNVGVDTISADGKYYYYTSGSLYLTSGTLNIDGPVVIDIRPTASASLDIETTGKIVIANNSTASLQIRFGGQLFIYSQNALGGIQNLTLDPKRCILIGTSTYNNSGHHYLASNRGAGQNLTFYGIIYMPNAFLHIYNAGTRTQNIYGALSARNIYFQHSANLHYDTSLRTATFTGIDAPYRITEWRELTDPTEKIVLP